MMIPQHIRNTFDAKATLLAEGKHWGSLSEYLKPNYPEAAQWLATNLFEPGCVAQAKHLVVTECGLEIPEGDTVVVTAVESQRRIEVAMPCGRRWCWVKAPRAEFEIVD